MLDTFLAVLLTYLREVAEVVVVGFVIAGILDAVINKEAIVRFLGGNVVISNLLGATIGVVTPLCCCTAIPTAMTLYRAGSRRGPACAFLIATPWFNWYGLTALIIFLGPQSALLIAGSAVLIGFCTGLVVDLSTPVQVPLPHTLPVAPACGCGDPSCAAQPATARLFDVSDPGGKVRHGLRFAADLLKELGLWIVGGIVLGALVETFVPEGVFTHYLGGASLVGLLAALVIAGLFSADSLGSLPWVQSLLQKGLGPGSAMVLLVAGVGTNLSTLGPVTKQMGRKTGLLYGTSVVLLAGLLGMSLNLALG